MAVKVFCFHCVSGHVCTRSLFGEEYCYIMDAKSVGNLGRYLNVRQLVLMSSRFSVKILFPCSC